MGFDHGLAPNELEWIVLTIGHISVNKYWGETERVRRPLCTSTLIHTSAGLVLVDPSVPAAEMPALLHDQAGVQIGDVRFVFLTHSHGDHLYGLPALPGARWLMSAGEIAHWRERCPADAESAFLDRIEPAGDATIPGLRFVPTPGHTPGTTSVVFDWRGRRVAVTGDAVMTEAHFRAGDGHSNSTDFGQVRATIGMLAETADVIVPGHGNAFAVEWTRTR